MRMRVSEIQDILSGVMKQKSSFWTTMPGVLTGVAALITAVGGILVGSGIITAPASKPATSLPSGPRIFRTVSGVGFWEKIPDGSWLEHSIQHPSFTMKFREY